MRTDILLQVKLTTLPGNRWKNTLPCSFKVAKYCFVCYIPFVINPLLFDFSQESFREFITPFQIFNRVIHYSHSVSGELARSILAGVSTMHNSTSPIYAILQKVRYTALGLCFYKPNRLYRPDRQIY